MHAGKPERGNDYNVSYWTPENPINDFARIRTYSGGASFNVWREKSFIRLDNVTLAYTIPTAICDKIHINNVKIFGTIRNAALWAAKWHFWDPEYSGPNPRYFNLGINMTI